MKKISSNVIAITIFILLLCYSMDFEMAALFNLRLIILIVVGIAILFIPHLIEGVKKDEIVELIGINGRTAGYIGTFILLFFNLSNLQEFENLLREVALSCRPLLYGFVIYEVCTPRAEKKRKPPEEGIPEPLRNRLASAGLTTREIQIALLINAGLSNKEIAEELFIAQTTVKKHISNIFDKLGIEKRNQIK